MTMDTSLGLCGSEPASEEFQDPEVLQRIRILSLEAHRFTRWSSYRREHALSDLPLDELGDEHRAAFERIQAEVSRDIASYQEEISSGPGSESGGFTLSQRLRMEGLRGRFNADMLAVIKEGGGVPSHLPDAQRILLEKLRERRDRGLEDYLVEIGAIRVRK